MVKKYGKKLKIAVGISGGVDSSVAAYLLKSFGHELTGVYLQCWDKDNLGCSSDEDRSFAVSVCSQLGIKFEHLNFVKEYKEKVITYFFDAYQQGLTPNPDILCNSEIKFGLFLKWALENDFDFVATGHYANVKKSTTGCYKLLAGYDKNKDQSYFLYRLNQHQLSKILFPIGHLTKKQVRHIALDQGLVTHNRPDSQGICFVGEVNIKDFLQKQLCIKRGRVLFIDGSDIGEHDGVWFYTIGQRHGFRINKYFGLPLYVVSKDAEKNILTVGYASDVLKKDFEVINTSWICKKPDKDITVNVRIRHLGRFHLARLKKFDNDLYKVEMEDASFGVAPGQSAVFYKKNDVIGGGIINCS